MKVLVTLGYFDAVGDGVIAEVDLAAGSWRALLRHLPPEPLRVAAKGFTGACWCGPPGQSPLLVCGHAAVFHVSADLKRVERTWHQPCMNDLHHVAVQEGQVYVVNTGLEAVDVFTLDGRFLGSHALHPGWVSAARLRGEPFARAGLAAARVAVWPMAPAPDAGAEGPGAYYDAAPDTPFSQRKVRDLLHLNHISFVGRQALVTCMLERSVHDLTRMTPIIEDLPSAPHDGVLDGDMFWLTCSNGVLCGYAVEQGQVTGRPARQLDLFQTTGRSGWCRGLLVTPEHFIVGLSEIRRMPRVRWCERPFADTETSILCVERQTGALVARVDLSDPQRQSKVFSILPCGSQPEG